MSGASHLFIMAGGGTGGHIFPMVAVAMELERRGHSILFVGTRSGMEARLVPAAGYAIEYIHIGGLKRVGLLRAVRTLLQLPIAILRMRSLLRRLRPAAVFSLGGYAAGPVAAAALLTGTAIVLMEPNAVPGLSNRIVAHWAKRALLNWPQSQRCFPSGRSEVIGLPTRPEFFQVPRRSAEDTLNVVITGGSRGSRTLNRAAIASWPRFRHAGLPIRFLHQCGPEAYEEFSRDFAAAGVEGKVVAFIEDMPAALAGADLVVCRAGAGSVSELAAAGKPAILVPFPYSADDHQTRNAEILVSAGAALLVPDEEMNGQRLFEEISSLVRRGEKLAAMAAAARSLARPGAAARAADILEEIAGVDVDSKRESRKNKTE